METATQNGMQYGYGFSLICDISSNLQVGDKVIINNQTYTVKGIATKGTGMRAVDYVSALITLPE